MLGAVLAPTQGDRQPATRGRCSMIMVITMATWQTSTATPKLGLLRVVGPRRHHVRARGHRRLSAGTAARSGSVTGTTKRRDGRGEVFETPIFNSPYTNTAGIFVWVISWGLCLACAVLVVTALKSALLFSGARSALHALSLAPRRYVQAHPPGEPRRVWGCSVL